MIQSSATGRQTREATGMALDPGPGPLLESRGRSNQGEDARILRWPDASEQDHQGRSRFGMQRDNVGGVMSMAPAAMNGEYSGAACPEDTVWWGEREEGRASGKGEGEGEGGRREMHR